MKLEKGKTYHSTPSTYITILSIYNEDNDSYKVKYSLKTKDTNRMTDCGVHVFLKNNIKHWEVYVK